MEDYHIIWKTQSRNSSESMPVGGGDIGGNVWVEENQVFMYLQQSGWFDENNSLLKAGRLRIQVEPNPFETNFEQELSPEKGCIEIRGSEFEMLLWIDIKKPVVHIEYKSESPRNIQVNYETWRFEDRLVDNSSYELFQCKEMFFYPLQNPVFYKDILVEEEQQLFFYHQNKNEELSFGKEFQNQGLGDYSRQVYNPQRDLICGGILRGDGLYFTRIKSGKYQDTSFKAYCYKTRTMQRFGSVYVALSAKQVANPQVIQADLETLIKEAKCTEQSDKKIQERWWKDYFSKSFIKGNPNQEKYAEIIRNYTLFRYMMGCNYYGFWPTKFNGGLFTFDPGLGGKSPWSDDELKYTPDFRLWGGGSHTIQNQRLLYWPMLKAGDSSVMKQHFDFFNRTLETAKIRCKESLHVEGAMYPEQVGTYGLCCGCDNEWGNRTGLPTAQIKYHFSNSLETSLMILEYYRFTGNNISEYMDFIKSIIPFYHNFYNQNDENGKMIIYPGNALETYHVVKNPIDAIAGLQAVVERMLQLPARLFLKGEKEQFKAIQKRIPNIQVREKEGQTVIAYADHPSTIHNCEIPELYAVFPYGQFGLGKEQLELAINTARHAWENDEQLSHISWHPTGIQYARLGMLKECEEFLIKKMGNGDFRFPAFWGPGHDWTPDHNWGGSGMIQLQEMLLQTEGKEIRILPCWNSDIDVHFKLSAPYETTVECKYVGGKIEELIIHPKERMKDVIFSL